MNPASDPHSFLLPLTPCLSPPSTYLGHLTLFDVTGASSGCVCVYICELNPQLSKTTEWSIVAQFYWIQLPSILSLADPMLLKEQSQLNTQGLAFFQLFITVHQAAMTYKEQQRPWQSDIVTNDGHLPSMKVLGKLIGLSSLLAASACFWSRSFYCLSYSGRGRDTDLDFPYIHVIRFTGCLVCLLGC